MGHLYHGYVGHNQRVTCGQVVLNIKSTDRRGATSSKAPFFVELRPGKCWKHDESGYPRSKRKQQDLRDIFVFLGKL